MKSNGGYGIDRFLLKPDSGNDILPDGGRNRTSSHWAPGFDGWEGSAKPKSRDEVYTRTHTWSFRGQELEWELEIPLSTYEYCTSRARTGNYALYIADPLQRPFIKSISEKLQQFCKNRSLGENDCLTAYLRFVQSIDYSQDIDDTGHEAYPKYAIETLIHQQGDCEDGTILLGSLLAERGEEVAVLLLPNVHHMMLGVSLQDDLGSFIEYEGTKYYTIETTHQSWDIGDLPPKYSDTKVEVHIPDNQPVLIHEWNATPNPDGAVSIDVHVANFGDAKADNVQVQMQFEKRNGESVSRQQLNCKPLSILPGNSTSLKGTMEVPHNHNLQGVCQVAIGRRLHDKSESEWH